MSRAPVSSRDAVPNPRAAFQDKGGGGGWGEAGPGEGQERRL
jgi:hypothetical protein